MLPFDLSTLRISEPSNQSANTIDWVKSFDLVYGSKSKPYKTACIDADEIHFGLRSRENQERQSRDYDINKSTPNYVVASMSFVVSDRPHEKGGYHGLKVVTIPIKFRNQEVTNVTNVFTFHIVEGTNIAKSSDLVEHIKSNTSVEKHAQIEEQLATPGPSFVQSFHHSERALWGALTQHDMINSIAWALFAKTCPSLNGRPVKIYSAVLHIHSTRYLCANCEHSAFYFQSKTGQFLRTLESVLRKGYTISNKNGITLLTTVSAEVQGKHKPIAAAVHQEFWANKNIKEIRSTNKSVVLQRDDRAIHGVKVSDYGLFLSSQMIKRPHPVFLAHRTDDNTSQFDQSVSNKQFIAGLEANQKQANDLLQQIAFMRGQHVPSQHLLPLALQAYDLCPQNFKVLEQCHQLFLENGRILEALDICNKIFKIAVKDHGYASPIAQSWIENYGCLNSCLLYLYDQFTNNHAQASHNQELCQRVFALHDDDYFLLFILRSRYKEFSFQRLGALEDLQKAFLLMRALNVSMPELEQAMNNKINFLMLLK